MDAIDVRTIKDDDVPGLSWKVEAAYDYATDPADDEFITPAQIEAWNGREWFYAGLIVTPVIAGTELNAWTNAQWGIEWGLMPVTDDNDEVTEVISIGLDLEIKPSGNYDSHIPEMIANSKARLAEGLGPVALALTSVHDVLARRENAAGKRKTTYQLSELDRAVWLLMQTDDYAVTGRGENWAELIYVHNEPPHPVTRIEIGKGKRQQCHKVIP